MSMRSIMHGKIPVSPSAIAGELDRIRREAATMDARRETTGADGAVAAPRARVTLCNLIILVDCNTPGEVRDSIENLLTELCVSYPSRFFLIEYDSDGQAEQEKLETAVSSRCVQTNSGVHMCSEEVYIRANAAAVDLVPNLLLSLFAPDVDSALLVLTDPAPASAVKSGGCSRLLQRIASVSNVVVYDSLLFSDYRRGLQALAPAADTAVPAGDAADEERRIDLTWKRIQRWRTLLAEQFDAASQQCDAGAIRSLRIGCKASPEALSAGSLPSDVQLFCGWFLAAMHWRPTGWEAGPPALLRAEDAEGRPCSVEWYAVAAEPGDDRPSALRRLEIGIGEGDSAFRLMLSRKVKKGVAEISTESSGARDAAACEFFARTAPFLTESFENIVVSRIGNEEIDREFLLGLSMARDISSVIGEAPGRNNR